MARGSTRMEWNGPLVKAGARDAAVRGLGNAAEHLLGQARIEVPFRQGDLTRSGRTHLFKGQLMAAVSFNLVYARRQHEETTWKHPIKGKAKYLADPFFREQTVMLAIVATAVRKAHG